MTALTAATLPVRTLATRVAILSEITQLIEAAEFEELLACGVEGETLDRVRALTTGEAQQLLEAANGLFTVRIDGIRFRWLLDTVENQARDAALLEYYVRHGASLAMIRALLKPDKTVLAEYVAKISGPRPRGRPSLPDATTRDRVHAWWANGRGTARPDRERLVELHRDFPGYTLATLFSVLNEFKR